MCSERQAIPRDCHGSDRYADWKRGIKSAFDELLNEETLEKYVTTMRILDWVLVYFKIKAHISDSTWKTGINFTKPGWTGVTLKNGVFLTANSYFNG